MARYGVKIVKGQQGPGTGGSPFRVSGLLTTGVAVTGKLTLGTPYVLTNINDAAALGLNKAYDTANNVVVFEHIDEYFRMATINGDPSPKLYLMVLAQTVTLAQMIDDATGIYAKKLLTFANGEIYNLAIGFNPSATYTETQVDGLNSDVRAAILKAQQLYQWSADNFRPAQMLLEGRGYISPAASVLDLRNIPDGGSGIAEYENVSIVIGQDYGFAGTLTGLAQKHAAIGTALGTVAACEVNQNIGEVDAFDLTDTIKGKWVTAGLSSHTTVADNQTDLDTLDTKGYIFPNPYVGISGYRWNDSATCTPIKIDTDGNINAYCIEYARTRDYAVRQLRTQLLPKVKSVQPVDPKTGLMPTGTIKALEKLGDDVFDDMVADGHLSGGKTTVDPTSDIVVARLVKISFNIVPFGVIGAISGTINLKKSI